MLRLITNLDRTITSSSFVTTLSNITSLKKITLLAVAIFSMPFLYRCSRALFEDTVDLIEGRVHHIEDRVDHIEDRVDHIEDRVDHIEDTVDLIEDRVQHSFKSDAEYRQMLQDWVNQADPNLRGDYISAQNAFLSFLREGHILRLTDLRIQNLPEQIGNHRAFQRLEQLSILGGSITSLPLSLFTKCPAMKLFVCISCSALTTIPAITDCPALEDIYFISCSALTTIPPITDCPALARISFMGCAALTTAPTITNCPALTRISFVHCRGLTGFSNELGHLSASLHTVYIKAGKPLPCFPKLLDDTSQERKTLLDKLKDWLERLSFAADKNQSFYALIVKNLELAEENEDFRILFWANVEEGCTTCGDRVTLSVLRMGMIRARMALKGQSLTEIWACLKQAWAIDILEVHAQNKANNMQNVDTIEIFLGYPIALKGRLGLSLDVNGMLFFTLSNLTEEDLNLAENDVKACWGNPEEAAFYLINQPEWIDGLKSTYPTEMAEVEDLTARRGSEDINEDEAMKLNDEIKSRLVKLSMNQLQKEMTA